MPRSFVENAADRTAVDQLGRPMSILLALWCLAGAISAPLWLREAGARNVLIGFFVLFALALLATARFYKPKPKPFSFHRISRPGMNSPASAIGIPLATAAVIAVWWLFNGSSNPRLSLITAIVGGIVVLMLASMSALTLFAFAHKWTKLAKAMEDPEVLGFLREIRDNYPPDVPFPFAASTDRVVVP